MNIYFHKIIFSCFLSLFIAEISAKTDSLPSNGICKVIKGQLADFRTKNDAEEVEINLKSLVTGKIYSTETDEEGNFYFYKVPLGKCSLSIVDRDYRPETFAFETNQDHLKNFTFSEPFKVNLKVSWMFNWGDRTIMLKSGKKYVQEHYWSHLLAKIILGIYSACLILIFYYSCIQLTLAIAYNKSKFRNSSINVFSFKGRIGRKEFLVSYLFYIIINIIIVLVLQKLKINSDSSYITLISILVINTPLVWYILAQSSKRCHDINKSGAYQFIPLFRIFLLFIKGDHNSNSYGENPYILTKNQKPVFNPETTPKVTIQLPMYNEMYVAERIIETAAAFDYPRDKFQIQVLDDSTDETKEIIAAKVAELAATGLNIQHIHRIDRTGYKAGALDDAMDRVQGEFIAIFDADFVPDKDFLIRTMPYFKEGIGVVQSRWGHLNKTYSLLTELQAFGLNGHFAIEQGGRNASGHFINFNGTAGIWRKTCIEEAGGWEHDTLTEDLDLSYRAQMRGWKFKYLEDVESPAELPITMSALKSQQHRWMKGGAECFIKMWKSLITFPGVKFSDRIHGFAHLFNSSVFVFILILSILSLFVLHIKDSFSDLNWFIQFGAFFIASTLFLSFYYWHSWRDKKGPFLNDLFRFIGRFIQFLTVSMALSLSNAVAVIEGYLGIKSSFVRTPKFNVLIKTEFKGNKYDKKSLSLINILEGLLMLVFGFTAVQRAIYGDLGMVPFHLMLTCGYGIIFFSTLKENRSQG